MKFSKLLVFALLFSLSFMACDEETTPEPTLAGNWALTSYETDIETVRDSAGLIITDITEVGTGSNFTMEIGFGENPNTFSSSGSFDLTTTVNEGGIIYPRTTTGVTFGFDGGTWSRIVNSINISKDFDITGFVITELTDTKLVLRFYALGQYSYNEIDYDFEQTDFYTFSRL